MILQKFAWIPWRFQRFLKVLNEHKQIDWYKSRSQVCLSRHKASFTKMKHEGRQESVLKKEFHSFVHYCNYTSVLNVL